MDATPATRFVVTWLREALSAVPIVVRPKQPTTHVEAVLQGSQDGGSIPPASTLKSATLRAIARWLFHAFADSAPVTGMQDHSPCRMNMSVLPRIRFPRFP